MRSVALSGGKKSVKSVQNRIRAGPEYDYVEYIKLDWNLALTWSGSSTLLMLLLCNLKYFNVEFKPYNT